MASGLLIEWTMSSKRRETLTLLLSPLTPLTGAIRIWLTSCSQKFTQSWKSSAWKLQSLQSSHRNNSFNQSIPWHHPIITIMCLLPIIYNTIRCINSNITFQLASTTVIIRLTMCLELLSLNDIRSSNIMHKGLSILSMLIYKANTNN